MFYGISGHIFGLILSFLSNRQLQVALDRKSSREYSVNTGVPQSSIAIYADDTTLCSKSDQASGLWQQLELLASELESDLQDTVDWGRQWLVDFNVCKTQLVSFDGSITLTLLM